MNTLVLVFAATVAVNFDDEKNAALPPLVEYPYVSIYYSNPTVKPVVKIPDCRKTKDAEKGSAVVSAENCAFKSPLYEVTARSEFTSERPVVFAAANCKGLKGELGRRPEKLSNWRDLVDAEWFKYKKEKLAR